MTSFAHQPERLLNLAPRHLALRANYDFDYSQLFIEPQVVTAVVFVLEGSPHTYLVFILPVLELSKKHLPHNLKPFLIS